MHRPDKDHTREPGSSAFSLCTIEAELATHKLRFARLHDPQAEALRLPSMAQVFDDLCARRAGLPPTQQEFVHEFASRYRAECPHLFGPRWPGVEARLRRAHPSFVRERHLEALLRDAGLTCTRSVSADQAHGVDLAILYGRFAVRLATFIGTRRGHGWRAGKINSCESDGIYFELPLQKEYVRRVGDYDLYGPWHVEAIRSALPQAVTNPPRRWTIEPRPWYVQWTAVEFTTSDELPNSAV